MDVKVIGLGALQDSFNYLLGNPAFLVRAAVNAARLRVGIPLDALRWLASHLLHGPKVPQDVEITGAPPALGLAMTVNLMGTPLRIKTALHVDDLRAQDPQLLLELRVRDLAVQAPPNSPAAQMFGAMDLSKPGNLMAFMPKRPPALIESRDDRFVFDLMRVPALAKNPLVARALFALAEVISVREIRVEDDMLVLALRATPFGLPLALARIRG
jgi:hypothetical protein